MFKKLRSAVVALALITGSFHANSETQHGAGVTHVSDIASKWRFSNFRRFSQKSKELFCLLPSKTLTKIPTRV